MGYQRGDHRYGGGDRWRDRERGRYGRDRDFDRGYRSEDDDRGFIDRAGDELRSWFGDEEAERRREADRRRFESERGYDDRDRGYREASHRRERFWSRDEDPYDNRYGEIRGGSGFGGDYDRGRRFDRVDVGSTGTHGAHPLTAPAGTTFGAGFIGPDRSYSRERAIYESSRRARSSHDPHYDEWRSRQIQELDRDYDDYRRENQSQFEREFGGWREKRRGQRAALSRVAEHMDVVGSDGEHLGTVDKVRGDRIILTRSDPDSGGHHHSIPCGWIDKVEDKVVLDKSADQARRAWTDEDTSRALFEREDRGSEGPHALDRSFSGTY